jgi:hypothetical protein
MCLVTDCSNRSSPEGARPTNLRPRMLVLLPVLLLAVVPSSQAADMKVVSPQAYANAEGESSVADAPQVPFRYQQVFPAADFAALGGQPHWITSITVRPDQRLSSPRTVTFPDNQLRLSTTATSPEDLNSRFDANFGPDVTQVYRGPVSLVADANTLSSVPRGFYQTSYPQEPFLYDPSRGNLLLDVIAWGGMSPSSVEDKTTSSPRTALYAPDPTAVFGDSSVAGIYQFTFVPVPEPSGTLLGVAILFVAAAVHRRR